LIETHSEREPIGKGIEGLGVNVKVLQLGLGGVYLSLEHWSKGEN